MDCVFCRLDSAQILDANEHCVAIRDAFPLSPGHTLIISKRHVASFFDLSAEEQLSMLALTAVAKRNLDAGVRPDGYNIGINDGPAAGQTVPHLHLHLIPRYAGERNDPKGGVRWIFPDKAKYWDD